MMGQITNGMVKRGKAYNLEMQSRYNGSDHEWHSKEIKNIHAEDAEQVQWVGS